jgi:hypothetical protein
LAADAAGANISAYAGPSPASPASAASRTDSPHRPDALVAQQQEATATSTATATAACSGHRCIGPVAADTARGPDDARVDEVAAGKEDNPAAGPAAPATAASPGGNVAAPG